MESENSASGDQQTQVNTEPSRPADPSELRFRERFESLLPTIQEYWPDLAWDTLEATRGSLDEMVRVISQHSGLTSDGVRDQLEDLFEQLLDELNSTLRPRIERPVRQRPLLAVAMAAGIGVLIGVIFAGGRHGSACAYCFAGGGSRETPFD